MIQVHTGGSSPGITRSYVNPGSHGDPFAVVDFGPAYLSCEDPADLRAVATRLLELADELAAARSIETLA